jgi:hypothetical protein
MLNAVKIMNPSQNKIPIVEFEEVKFEPAILRLKTSSKPAARQRGRPSAAISGRDAFAKEWRILRAGSEGVRLFGPLVQPFRPRPPRSLNDGAKRPAGEPEMRVRK